jgi:putative heme iron utilization protein
MKRRHQKKLSVNRETVRNLTPEHLEKAKAAAAEIAACSDCQNCDPDCGSTSTLSCTL